MANKSIKLSIGSIKKSCAVILLLFSPGYLWVSLPFRWMEDFIAQFSPRHEQLSKEYSKSAVCYGAFDDRFLLGLYYTSPGAAVPAKALLHMDSNTFGRTWIPTEIEQDSIVTGLTYPTLVFFQVNYVLPLREVTSSLYLKSFKVRNPDGTYFENFAPVPNLDSIDTQLVGSNFGCVADLASAVEFLRKYPPQ